MATSTSLSKTSPTVIHNRIESLVKEINRDTQALEKNWVKLAPFVVEVSRRILWEKWGFKSFNDWRLKELSGPGFQRTSTFKMIAVHERLTGLLSEGEMEQLGSSKTYQLARLAKKKPKLVKEAAKRISAPEVTFEAARSIVDQAIEGHGLKAVAYKSFDTLIRVDDLKAVTEVFEIFRYVNPLPDGVDPDSFVGRGLLLVGLCDEYRGSEEFKEAEKDISRNGTGGFEVEE